MDLRGLAPAAGLETGACATAANLFDNDHGLPYDRAKRERVPPAPR